MLAYKTNKRDVESANAKYREALCALVDTEWGNLDTEKGRVG